MNTIYGKNDKLKEVDLIMPELLQHHCENLNSQLQAWRGEGRKGDKECPLKYNLS